MPETTLTFIKTKWRLHKLRKPNLSFRNFSTPTCLKMPDYHKRETSTTSNSTSVGSSADFLHLLGRNVRGERRRKRALVEVPATT